MVFIVGATYDILGTLELKSKEELPCVDVLLISDILLLLSLPLYNISLKITTYKPYLYNMERFMLMWKFFTCLLLILTISLISDTHETLLKCKEPVKRFCASKIKRERRESFITITQLQLLT